jgi:hypothetical protein
VRKPRLPLVAVALAAAALVVPAAAQAKLPVFSDSSFVANVGIGGVKLKQGHNAANHAWGMHGECSDFSCRYQDPRRSQLGYAQIGFEDGKRGGVSQLEIGTGTDLRSGKPVFGTPLATIESAAGIGLGSSQRAVKAAYPKAKSIRGAPDFLILTDSKRNQTLFSFTNHRLTRIIIQDGRLRG